MATVTGMTAAAMQAIRDGTVVNGHFDSAGHLILTKYDETQIDVGAVLASSTTQAGIVELATTSETTTGTDTVRAVTPSGLAAVKALLLPLAGGIMTGAINSTLALVSDIAQATTITGDTFDRFRSYADGKEERGPGNAARDANWYRSAVGVMKTDTAISVGTDLSVAGNINSSANVNTGAWATFTPTWTASGTAPSLGNGTLIGRYQRIGRTIKFHINLAPGSTTTFGTGTYSFAMPVISANNGCTMTGTAEALVTNVFGGICVISPNVTTLTVWFPGSTTATNLTSSGPTIAGQTFASGHSLRITGEYEAAS